MINDLKIIRTNINYSLSQRQYLNDLSDHEIDNEYIFAKVIKDSNELDIILSNFLNYKIMTDDLFNKIKDIYTKSFFIDKSLIIMFSDERSGSNVLTIKNINIEDSSIMIDINRNPGLTMDMAYLFMFIEIENKTINKALVKINTSY